MGEVYDQFELELASLGRKYARQPRRQMLRLFLLALEREEIVSVGYREELIAARLDKMPISEQEREIIRHALLWIWKDEEMHAIYIRGAIFKIGAFSLRARALLRQMEGALGGWATSVRQHVRWSDAPFSRTLATLLTWSGSITGKVPPDVRQHIRYSSFRDFCLFNVDAEKTAWLCWQRLIELAGFQPFMLPSLIDDFRRIKEDEDRHRQIFEILANALDDKDELVPEETADALAKKIGTVGEAFLPRARRHREDAENPLGSGGRVRIVQGKTLDEKVSLFRKLLDGYLKDQLLERAASLNKPLADFRVAIKPAFMLGYDRRDQSMITDRELLAELGRFLRERGCKDIAVVEGRNLYDQFYDNRSVLSVAKYFDISSPHFRVVDLSDEQIPHSYFRGMAQYTVGKTWKDADFRISFAKMKSHPVESVHLTIANLEGVGTRCEHFLFAERQADRETATMMLLDEFPPHFSILDAYEKAADGLVGVMGCTQPPTPLRFYAGRDGLAVDMVASRHMGLNDPRDASTLRAACHWFGDPEATIEIDGPDEPLRGWRSPYYSEFSTMLSFVALPVYVLGSGRGSLFVPEMDHRAFPPLRPESLPLRLGRYGTQNLLGLRHRK
ncbi:MAG TPA: DUF362 domain-containing protein [Pyrinomonadaceae bacterium]|nr:DUF362 domain-containing protein [Pyrinomonadaceae bacterium]